jgi:hypothetical protein
MRLINRFGTSRRLGTIVDKAGNDMLTKSIKGVAFSGLLIAGVAAAATVTSSASTALPGQTSYIPMQAIGYDLGSKLAIGYFVREAGACQVVLMIDENADPEKGLRQTAARLRLALLPGQVAGLDSEEGRSLDLTCGEGAATLVVRSGPTAEVATLSQ